MEPLVIYVSNKGSLEMLPRSNLRGRCWYMCHRGRTHKGDIASVITRCLIDVAAIVQNPVSLISPAEPIVTSTNVLEVSNDNWNVTAARIPTGCGSPRSLE
jgi:hypothetical protein